MREKYTVNLVGRTTREQLRELAEWMEKQPPEKTVEFSEISRALYKLLLNTEKS